MTMVVEEDKISIQRLKSRSLGCQFRLKENRIKEVAVTNPTRIKIVEEDKTMATQPQKWLS